MHTFIMTSPQYLHSQPASRYGSPAPSQWSPEMYPGHPHPVMGYDAYGSPMPMHVQPQAYGSPPYANMMRDPSTPPTSSHSQDGTTTERKQRRSTPKRKNKSNGESAKVPHLEAPLSELTKHMKEVPVKDMEAHVNRPLEERRQETEKRQGYITRPMNSFMLYRSAYADRTKRWCEQNNHQVVSSVSGKSWPMEPPEIRNLYNELARIERDNHQKAHPGYKFSPSKTATAPAKKRKDLSDEEGPLLDMSDDDDVDDDDPDYRPSGGSKRRSRPASGLVRNGTPELGQYPHYGGMANSVLQYPVAHDGSPLIAPLAFQAAEHGMIGSDGMLDHHAYGAPYAMHEHFIQNGLGDGVRDIHLLRQAPPGYQQMGAQPGHSVVGLPGTGRYDLLDEHNMTSTPVPFDSSHIDPMLMANEYGFPGQGSMSNVAAFSEQSFRDFDDEQLAEVGSTFRLSVDGEQQWNQQTRPEDAEFMEMVRDSLKTE